MTDEYEYWRNALQGNFGAVHEGHPQCGFYRKRNKDGLSTPVAIWKDNGEFVATAGEKLVDASDIWTWVCRYPVTHEAYEAAKNGKGWPDEAAPVGHNSGEVPDDPCEALKLEFEQEKEQAKIIIKQGIETQQQADMAASWVAKLSNIAKRANDLHKVEKQPHLDAGRAVDNKWRDLKEEPKELATDIKRAADRYLQRVEKERREAEEKARQEAERIRREAEEAAAKAGADEAVKLAQEAQEKAAEIERQAKAQNASAGRTGSKIALRTFVSAEITDYDKLLMALKDRQEMRELVQSLANRAAKSGVTLDGMKIKEEKRAV